MKKILPIVLTFLSFSLTAAAQVPSPAPTPTPDNDVVKISTALIQLDVTVTDSKGNPITDLRRDEIEVFENGKKQDISGFSFVDGRRTLTVSEGEKREVGKNASAQPIVPVPGSQRPEKIRRTIALVVDDLSLSFSSAYWTRLSVRKFVLEQMRDGDLVAIIRTGAGIGALQQFTTDRQQLLAAADKIKYNFSGTAPISDFEPIRLSAAEEINGTTGANGKKKNMGDEIKLEQERNAAEAANDQRIQQTGTLGALNFIVRGMQDLPGRKSVVLLSNGLSIFRRDAQGTPTFSDTADSLQGLIDFANRASVVFYTLDARGLVAEGPTAEDDITDLFDANQSAKLDARGNELRDKQDGLKALAKGTGGLAYLNQNNLSRGIEKALLDQSYYLVAYEPDDKTFDPKTAKFNKIEIKVTRPGVRVRYRSGFYGVSDEAMAEKRAKSQTTLMNALSSPFAVQGIDLRFNPVFIAGEKDSLFVRTYLHLDAKDLTFTKQPDGAYETTFEIAGVSLGDNGAPVDFSAKSFTLRIRADVYERVAKKGIVYEFTYPIKKAGPLQYRVAVRDPATNRVGSANQFLNVPDLKKAKLSLSGLIFENTTLTDGRTATDPTRDTALRQFKRGSGVRYGYSIYDGKPPTGTLTAVVRIYRDGKLLSEGQPTPIDAAKPDGATGITAAGAIRIGTAMEPGEYVLQITVTEATAGSKPRSATQFASFEVVE